MSFYETSVTNFGDYEAIGKVPCCFLTTLKVQILVGTLLAILVQIFYAYRIWTISHKSFYVPVTIVRLKESLYKPPYTVRALQMSQFNKNTMFIPFSTGALSCEVACNLLITISMMYWLSKRPSSFGKVLSICCLVTLILSPETLTFGFFFFVLARLYGCSFMSILNSREHIRKQLYTSTTDHPMLSMPSYQANGKQEDVETQVHMDEPVGVFEGRTKKGGSRTEFDPNWKDRRFVVLPSTFGVQIQPRCNWVLLFLSCVPVTMRPGFMGS
ncbi:hypothetical protein DFH09DRAFT_1099968 [Mycena vulgaris]|nr:hypothetical protein DFH09DRAFT_1099968 [Mycena vulgaris]